MKPKSVPTREYSESRKLYSSILEEARAQIAARKRFITVTRTNPWSKTSYEETGVDLRHLDVLIENKYVELRSLYEIPFHFDEFRLFVARHPDLRIHLRYSGIFPPYWQVKGPRNDGHGLYYRKGPGFTQHGIDPKEIDEKEAQRREWRKSKGMDKDKQKAGQYRNGPSSWLKRSCNKTHRQWERECLKKERYDEMAEKSLRKDFFDPWMWD